MQLHNVLRIAMSVMIQAVSVSPVVGISKSMFSVVVILILSTSASPTAPMTSASGANKHIRSLMENVPALIQAALMKEEPMNATSVLSE